MQSISAPAIGIVHKHMQSVRLRVAARRSARQSFLRLFNLCDRMGFHVLPRHYYSPVIDRGWLERHKELWTQKLRLYSIPWNLDHQIEWLDRTCAGYYGEVRGLEVYRKICAREWGPGFGPIESQVLHCFLRSVNPARIIEIGSGVSTACMCEARRRNVGDGRPSTEITCIEPFAKPAFSRLPEIRHISQLCQAVPASLFCELKAGDLLFIDSSHAVKTGSDVIRIYLDIIPSLAPGVIVHIHDIYLPYAYPRDALSHFFGWQETALLAALLTANDRLQVLACLSALHYDRSREMQEILADYLPQANDRGLQPASAPLEGHFPSSLWLSTR